MPRIDATTPRTTRALVGREATPLVVTAPPTPVIVDDARAQAAARIVAAPAARPAAAPVAALVRAVAASSGDVVRAVDALVAGPPSPLRDEVMRRLAAGAPVDVAHAPSPRRAEDALKVTALLLALAPHVRDGALDTGGLAKAAGPGGARLLAALAAADRRAPPARTNFAFLADVVQIVGMIAPRDEALAMVDRFLRDDALLPRTVPALHEVKAHVAPDRFVNEGLVAAQHLFPTSLAVFEALIEKGMRPSRIHVLGTPYASNPLVVAVLRLMGVDAQPGRDQQRATIGFEEQRVTDLHHFLRGCHGAVCADRPPRGYQLLDDGGLLQRAASGMLPERMPAPYRAGWSAALRDMFPPGTRAVEQTTRGITELAKQGPAFATVSVAQCEAKKLEGSVIGAALVRGLAHSLAQRGDTTRKVAIVGAGTVGIETAKTARDSGYDVVLVDRDPAKRAAAEAAGFSTRDAATAQALVGIGAVLSCTGKAALSGEALATFTGVVASGSSMAIEGDLRQLASFRLDALDVANGMRPVNFDGTGHENLTAAQIGVTRALVFAALAQEVDAGKPGFVDVDADLQRVAIDAWRAAGGDLRVVVDTNVIDRAQRPDAVATDGLARHDEWIAFLAGLARPVTPRPTEQQRAPGPYFFADTDGAVRLVDTRGPGGSAPVALPGVPVFVHHTCNRDGAPLEVVCDVDGERRAYEVSAGPPARSKSLFAIDRTGPSFIQDDGAQGTLSDRKDVGRCFVSGGALQLRRPGAATYRKIELPQGFDPATTSVTWAHRDVLVVVDKSRAAVATIALDDGAAAPRVRAGLPKELVSVDALAVWNDPTHLVFPIVVVGKDAAGHPRAAVLTPAPSDVVLLPDDATLRNLKPQAGGPPGTFVVEYTLPGDPVERESFRSLVVDALAGIDDGDAAGWSMQARLREALTT